MSGPSAKASSCHEHTPHVYMIGIREEVRRSDERYGSRKQTDPPGVAAAWLSLILFKVAKKLMRLGESDSWRRVLFEEVFEVFAVRAMTRDLDHGEQLAGELTQVAATAHRWLRQLEDEGSTAQQSHVAPTRGVVYARKPKIETVE